MRAHDDMAVATGGPVPGGGELVAVAAELLGHLADPTRLHLLRLLAAGELDVTGLTAEVAASRSSVSQHLGRLRLAGLVQVRRDGRRMLYRLTSDHVGALVEEACQFAAHVVGEIPHHRRPD